MTDVQNAAQGLAQAIARLRQAERAAELGHRRIDDLFARLRSRFA